MEMGTGPKRLTPDLLPLLRECKMLEKKRAKSTLSEAEHARWLALKDKLGSTLGAGARERRASTRVPTRLSVSYATPEAFHKATLTNISRGGVFVSTAFPAEIGDKITLCLEVASSGTKLELPCTVVSQNVGSGFDTQTLGMGLRFGALTPRQQKAVDKLHAQASSEAD